MGGVLDYGPADRHRPPALGPEARGRGPRRSKSGDPAPTESARTYAVALSDEQKERLLDLIRGEEHRDPGRLKRARALLLAEKGYGDTAVAETVGVDRSTVWRVRKRFAQGGCERVLVDKPRGGPRKFDADRRARIVELARSEPPKGAERWTLQLLAERLVELEVVDAISIATVRSILMDNAQRRGERAWQCWR